MVDLKKVIKRYNVTQTDLATRWGVYQSAVSQMLGGNKISLDKLEDLAKACGCTLSELLAEENANSSANFCICPKCGAKLSININIESE